MSKNNKIICLLDYNLKRTTNPYAQMSIRLQTIHSNISYGPYKTIYREYKLKRTTRTYNSNSNSNKSLLFTF